MKRSRAPQESIGTNDLPQAAAFYDTLLAEIGITRMMESGGRGYAWAAAMDKPMLCVFKPTVAGQARWATASWLASRSIRATRSNASTRRRWSSVASTKAPSACAPKGGGGFYSGYFRDLDGNKLDLFCYG